MAYEDVYRGLVYIFPQIDLRVLRAVAIEHSEDFCAAVQAVSDDIIPCFSKISIDGLPKVKSTEVQDGCKATDLKFSGKTHVDGINLSGDNYCHGESVRYVDRSGVIFLHMDQSVEPESIMEMSADTIPQHKLEKRQDIGMGVNQTGPLGTGFGMSDNQENDEKMSSIDGNSLFDVLFGHSGNSPQSSIYGNSLLDGLPWTDLDVPFTHPASSRKSVEVPIMHGSVSSLLSDIASKVGTMSNIVGTEDGPLRANMSQSNQIIHGLDEIIADARYNKKIIFSTLESVINMMRQVELTEQAAEQAKKDAAVAEVDIMNKVDELELMLEPANKANQMHAEEVYREKVNLKTGMRDLHARVLSQSDERDESLGVLDEMRQTLELRLAAAENEIKAAEQEKLDKEIAARMLFRGKESMMEKVVQESKILKQLSKYNAKLQEFLADRGRIVDTLQGEIAVICQDVKLLKEKFDETGSFSKSLSSSQISFISASSNSLSKSLIPDQTASVSGGDDSLETRNETDHAKVSEEEASGDDRMAFLDDEWDFLDHDVIEV